MNVLKLLLVFLLITFPTGVLLRFEVGPSAYVYPTDIVLALLFSYSVYLYALDYKKIEKLPFLKPFLFFVGASLLSLVFSIFIFQIQEVIIGSLYLARFLLYANLLFVFCFVDKKFVSKYLQYAGIAGFAVVLLGFMQYFFYPDLRNLFYLGWDEHLYRLFSTFLDPNFAGSFFVLELLLAAYLFKNEQTYNRRKKFWLIVSILTFIALFLTYSRSAYIIFLISFGLVFLLLRQKKIMITMFVIFVLGILLLPKGLEGEGVKLLRTKSIMDRLEADAKAVQVIEKHPFFGVGFNNYRYAQKKYGFLDKNWQHIHSGAGVPNTYLFVLATTGVVGFSFYLYFLFSLIKEPIKRVMKKKEADSAVLVIASTGGLLIGSLFDNFLFYSSLMVWLFILVGCYYRKEENRRK